jgi:hypothetical protein
MSTSKSCISCVSFGYLMKEGGHTVNKLVLFFIDSFASLRKLDLLLCE